jgi:hypothetical protein
MTTPADDDALAAVRLGARRFGWASLLVWSAAGVSLEAAHAWKVAALLDDELTRLLLRLGHAHGAVLALVVLAFGEAGAPLFTESAPAARASRLLRAAAVLVPVGFALGAVAHPEGDPGFAIFLVPPGALCLLAGLALVTLRAFRP